MCFKQLALCYLKCLKSNKKYKKPGIKYDQIKSQFKPLDLILFRGDDFVSNTISELEDIFLGNGNWSHCGLVLTTDIIPIKNGKPGVLYIWESTFDEVADVELDEQLLGVQVRELKKVVKNYDMSKKTSIAWCKLKNNILYDENNNIDPNIKFLMCNLYIKYNHKGFDYNVGNLCSTICKCCCNNNNDRLFCSELVATIYKELNIIPNYIDPQQIAPIEFLGFTDNDLPQVVNNPVVIKY